MPEPRTSIVTATITTLTTPTQSTITTQPSTGHTIITTGRRRRGTGTPKRVRPCLSGSSSPWA